MLPFFASVCFQCRVNVLECRVSVRLYGIEFTHGQRGLLHKVDRQFCAIFGAEKC